jgi:peptidoglycan hydrolase-like protein with peptidoglycan-binding domain
MGRNLGKTTQEDTMRWTRFAIAVVIAACAKGERDQSSQSVSTTSDTAMSSATTPADSSSVATAATVTPKKAAAKPAKSDTAATARTTATATGGAPPTTGPSGAEAMMGVRPAVAPLSLSKDQVKQLQAALKKNGCYKGTPDGVTGPGTQSAIDCGLEKYKLSPNDMSELYRKLGLKF